MIDKIKTLTARAMTMPREGSSHLPEAKHPGGALRVTLLLLCMAVWGVASAMTPEAEAMRHRADSALHALCAGRAIDTSRAAVLITDLQTGKDVCRFNETTSLIPASIMKAVTIAALLQETGPQWRYVTEVSHDGRIKDGVLEGNLIITGACDPTLDAPCDPPSAEFLSETLAALRQAGIREIVGKIFIDSDAFAGPACPPTWASGDLPHSYGTGSHALNWRGNASGKKAVSDPQAQFMRELTAALKGEGVAVTGLKMPDTKRHTLLKHESAPIEDIMRSCMMRSDNLFAESMLRTYSVLRGGDGSTASGAELETERWRKEKMPLEGVRIVDGSGLSRTDRVTARFMASVLRKMKDNVEYASFLPLAGQEGTLKNFLAETPLDSYIAMKTGSMNGIQCYAGYKLDEEFAPTHAIVIILNALPAGRPAARAALERLLLAVFAP